MMIASAKAVIRGRQINSNFHFGTMICHITRYPRTCHPDDVLLVLKNDLFYNNTCADVMLKGEYPFYALNELEKRGVALQLNDTEKALLKEGSVITTPFPIIKVFQKVPSHSVRKPAATSWAASRIRI